MIIFKVFFKLKKKVLLTVKFRALQSLVVYQIILCFVKHDIVLGEDYALRGRILKIIFFSGQYGR